MKISSGTKKTLLITLGLLWASGVVTWIMGSWFQVDDGLGPAPSPFRIWWLQLHSVTGMFFMILFGYLWHAHVRPSWMRRRRIWSGGVLTAALIVLIVTVPLLFYVINETVKSQVALVHTYLGLALVLPFFYHYFFARD